MMMESFRYFVEQMQDGGYPVVSVVSQPGSLSLHDKKYRDEINSELASVTEIRYQWPLVGYESIVDVLSQFGIHLPNLDVSEENGGSDEIVLGMKTEGELSDDDENASLFLYLFYTPTSKGNKTEWYAEIVNESELEELLNEFSEDEGDENNKNDDSDDNGQDGEEDDEDTERFERE